MPEGNASPKNVIDFNKNSPSPRPTPNFQAMQPEFYREFRANILMKQRQQYNKQIEEENLKQKKAREERTKRHTNTTLVPSKAYKERKTREELLKRTRTRQSDALSYHMQVLKTCIEKNI